MLSYNAIMVLIILCKQLEALRYQEDTSVSGLMTMTPFTWTCVLKYNQIQFFKFTVGIISTLISTYTKLSTEFY